MWRPKFKNSFIYSNKIKEVHLPALSEKISLSMSQVHTGKSAVHINQIVSRDLNFMKLSKASGDGKAWSILEHTPSVPQCLPDTFYTSTPQSKHSSPTSATIDINRGVTAKEEISEHFP